MKEGRASRTAELVSADDYRARYLVPAGRDMKLWKFYRAALARVT